MNPDVLIVGAGPVGLFTAIEMKLKNPQLQIKILERNKEYSRHHILRLNKDTLIGSEAYEKYAEVRNLTGFIPTSQIEGTFLKIAQDLGVEIERGVKVDDANALLDQYPSAHSIIGADGAHSKIRAQLFNDEKIVDTNLQHIVEIKYKVRGPTTKLAPITYANALGQVNHLVSENIGKEKDGLTPVSLFVFVSEKTYQEIRHTHNAKLADLKPTTTRMENLLNTIRPWLSLRKASLNENMVFGSESINGVALNVYQSKYFAKKIKGKNAYLVGDAGAAVPYFQALNAGLKAARRTAHAIATQANPNLEELNATLSQLTKAEIDRANQQDFKVRLGRKANTTLVSVSKIPTGALLTDREEQAMLNARVTKPNILRRNPRFVISIISILVLSALLTPFIMPHMLTMMSAILVSAALATVAVSIMAGFVKLISWYNQYQRDKENPVESLDVFPWEHIEEVDSSFSLSHLSKVYNDEDQKEFKEPPHHGNPLRTGKDNVVSDQNEAQRGINP